MAGLCCLHSILLANEMYCILFFMMVSVIGSALVTAAIEYIEMFNCTWLTGNTDLLAS